MHKWQNILIIVVPTALLLVASIAFMAIQLLQSTDGSITADNGSFAAEETSLKDLTQRMFTQPSTPRQDDSGGSLLYDWQDSDNIKYVEYIARTYNKADTTQADINTAQDNNSTDEYVDENTPDDDSFDIWGWVPRTTASSPKPIETVQDNPAKVYANALGVEIKHFAITTGDQTQIMQDFVVGRGEPGNKSALLTLGTRYTNMGIELANIGNVSNAQDDISASGNKLAAAYKNVGAATILLAEGESLDDTSTLQDIYTYNESVDDFASSYINFANIMGAYGIEFSQGEGGDIFTPPM